MAVDALINTIVAGWDWNDESAAMKVAKTVGETLLDEFEMARLRDPNKGAEPPCVAVALPDLGMVRSGHGSGWLVAPQLRGGVRPVRERAAPDRAQHAHPSQDR